MRQSGMAELLESALDPLHTLRRLRGVVAVLTGLAEALEQQLLRWEVQEQPKLQQVAWRVWQDGQEDPQELRSWQEWASEKQSCLLRMLVELAKTHATSVRVKAARVRRAASITDITLFDILEAQAKLAIAALPEQPPRPPPEPHGPRQRQAAAGAAGGGRGRGSGSACAGGGAGMTAAAAAAADEPMSDAEVRAQPVPGRGEGHEAEPSRGREEAEGVERDEEEQQQGDGMEVDTLTGQAPTSSSEDDLEFADAAEVLPSELGAAAIVDHGGGGVEQQPQPHSQERDHQEEGGQEQGHQGDRQPWNAAGLTPGHTVVLVEPGMHHHHQLTPSDEPDGVPPPPGQEQEHAGLAHTLAQTVVVEVAEAGTLADDAASPMVSLPGESTSDEAEEEEEEGDKTSGPVQVQQQAEQQQPADEPMMEGDAATNSSSSSESDDSNSSSSDDSDSSDSDSSDSSSEDSEGEQEEEWGPGVLVKLEPMDTVEVLRIRWVVDADLLGWDC